MQDSVQDAMDGMDSAAQQPQDAQPPAAGDRWSGESMSRYSEIGAAIMLSIATVLTAWCAYQATRWSGVQATSFAEASTARVESTREFSRGMQLLTIDAATFLQYVEAFSDDKTTLLEFFETRLFRVDFLPYFEEWMATDPLTNPESPRNPFANDAYFATLFTQSDELEAQAAAKFEEAKDANQTGDDYILATVVFASVLFFAGISTKFDSGRVRLGLVALGVVMLVAGIIQFGTLPIH